MKRIRAVCWLGLMGLLLVWGCKPPTESPAQTTPDPPQVEVPQSEPAPTAARPWTLHAFYHLDDKYQRDTDPDELAAWEEELIASLANEKAAAYDLFTHKGGGPMGAEWNSDGDLLVCWMGAAPVEGFLTPEILFNGHAPENSFEAHTSGDLQVFILNLPGEEWNHYLRPIEEGDYPLIYKSEDLEEEVRDNGRPFGVGEILVVEVTHPIHVIKAFHIAYGE